MSVNELKIHRYYTDRQGRFRQIAEFFDGFDGVRMVKYYKVANTIKGIVRIGEGICSKKSFASWAKMQCLI